MSVAPFPRRRDQVNGGNGGNGSRDDRLLERIHGVESDLGVMGVRLDNTATRADLKELQSAISKMDVRLDNTATKADLKELQSSMLKWCIVTLLGAVAAMAAVMAAFQ